MDGNTKRDNVEYVLSHVVDLISGQHYLQLVRDTADLAQFGNSVYLPRSWIRLKNIIFMQMTI